MVSMRTCSFARTALILIGVHAPFETSWSQDVDVRQVFGSQPWSMTEIDGGSAIRHSPTRLTFRAAGRFSTLSSGTLQLNQPGLHVDDGCRFWILRIEAFGPDQSIKFTSPERLQVPEEPCSPSLEAQAAKLAETLVKAEAYEVTQGELLLKAAGRVLARFTSSTALWPKSDLIVRDATFWTAVEIGGNAVAANDRVTLNLVARDVIGRVGSCIYSGNVRHGHGEIDFWNLTTISGYCGGPTVRAFLDALVRSARYESERNTLVLHAAHDAVIARFDVKISDVATAAWYLVELYGRRLPASFSLALRNGRISGSVVCNSLVGRVRFGDGIVAFPDGISATQKACPGKSAPHPNLSALARAKRFEVSHERLMLFDESGTIVARFNLLKPTAR